MQTSVASERSMRISGSGFRVQGLGFSFKGAGQSRPEKDGGVY